jgi:hypothetical protein
LDILKPAASSGSVLILPPNIAPAFRASRGEAAGQGWSAERGGRQDQLVYPPGVGQGHLLGDRAAERHSQDVGGIQAQVIQDARADVRQAPH